MLGAAPSPAQHDAVVADPFDGGEDPDALVPSVDAVVDRDTQSLAFQATILFEGDVTNEIDAF